MAAIYKRRQKLPMPAFQLKLVGVFLGLGVACVFIQFALLSRTMTTMAMQAPEGEILLGLVGSLLWKHLLLTLGLLVPLTASLGILVTFRIAGPIYHFESHLRSVLAGETPPPLKLRDGDELVELCNLLNQVLEERTPSTAEFVEPVEISAR